MPCLAGSQQKWDLFETLRCFSILTLRHLSSSYLCEVRTCCHPHFTLEVRPAGRPCQASWRAAAAVKGVCAGHLLAQPGDTTPPCPVNAAATVQQRQVSTVPQPTGSLCKQDTIHQARPGPGAAVAASHRCLFLPNSHGYSSVGVLWVA